MLAYNVLERTASHTIIQYPCGTRVKLSNNIKIKESKNVKYQKAERTNRKH